MTLRNRLALRALLIALGVSCAAWAKPQAPSRGKTVRRPAAALRDKPKKAPEPPGPLAESPLTARATQTLGSISVGHPHAGYLINGVKMPQGPFWSIGLPSEAWGTDETIRDLVHCIERVNEQFPNTPRIVIGTISAQHGGALAPHKSHRTGRDADVALYYIDGKWHWNDPAGAHNLDRARSWAFLRAVITETDVEFVLVDRAVQVLLEEHALAVGEDPDWVREVFHGNGPEDGPLVKHVPGHTAHMHVRFVSPLARERGRLAYDQLVAQGHVKTGSRKVEHPMVDGDTLSQLAAAYGTTVEAIREANQLDAEAIRVGQVLVIQQREDIRGARDAVVVPPRKLPKPKPASAPPATVPVDRAASVRPRAARLLRVEPPRER